MRKFGTSTAVESRGVTTSESLNKLNTLSQTKNDSYKSLATRSREYNKRNNAGVPTSTSVAAGSQIMNSPSQLTL